MLIFSPVPISNVELKIDDGEWQNCDNIRGPLYVSQWNQNHFWKGLHVISVSSNFFKRGITLNCFVRLIIFVISF